MVSDSEDQIVPLLSDLMNSRTEFIGTPTELSDKIDPDGSNGCTPKKVARQILQNAAALEKAGIVPTVRRSNGKRLIELRRAESDDSSGGQHIDPCGTGPLQQDRDIYFIAG